MKTKKKLIATNFKWRISGDYPETGLAFEFYTPKTRLNRFKWWISTKLFLPGTYKWKDK